MPTKKVIIRLAIFLAIAEGALFALWRYLANDARLHPEGWTDGAAGEIDALMLKAMGGLLAGALGIVAISIITRTARRD